MKRKYVKKSVYWQKFKKAEETKQLDLIEEVKHGEDQEEGKDVPELRQADVEV